MRGTYRDRKRGNDSWKYFLISILLIVVFIKWGIPFFLEVISGPSDKKIKITEEAIPPIIPQLSALPEATFSASIVVEGFTDSGIEVTTVVNDQNGDSTITDKDGAFSLSVKLVDGENRIQVKAKNGDQKESASVIKIVTRDDKPINITLDSPKDGTEFSGKSNQVVEFRGKVDKPDSELTINNAFARVMSDGKFSLMFRLNEGDNDITLVATDKAGNRSEKSLRLTFSL